MRRALCVVVLLSVFLAGCAPGRTAQTGFAFDTLVEITIYGDAPQGAIDDCFDLLSELNALWNRFDGDSDVGRINSGQEGAVDARTVALVQRSLNYSTQTGGLFDAALGRLSDAWGFGGTQSVPSRQAVDEALAASGMAHVRVEEGRVTVQGGALLDLGGVAKGTAADLVAQLLREKGITSAVVNLGGNVVCVGGKAGEPFTIGIQTPFGQSGELSATVRVQDACVVTSGIYQRYFTQEDAVYSHVIDPRTGQPCDSDLAGATVIAKSAEWADALSTALLLMGKDDALAYLDGMEGAEAVLIARDGAVVYTSGLEGRITVLK